MQVLSQASAGVRSATRPIYQCIHGGFGGFRRALKWPLLCSCSGRMRTTPKSHAKMGWISAHFLSACRSRWSTGWTAKAQPASNRRRSSPTRPARPMIASAADCGARNPDSGFANEGAIRGQLVAVRPKPETAVLPATGGTVLRCISRGRAHKAWARKLF